MHGKAAIANAKNAYQEYKRLFLSPRFNVAMYGWWQWAHGGIPAPITPSNPHFAEWFPVHDQIGADEYFNLGLGGGYAFTPTMTFFATYAKGLEGKNGHRVNQGVTFGFSYGFRPRASAASLRSGAPSTP